jgi:hypothetical protein
MIPYRLQGIIVHILRTKQLEAYSGGVFLMQQQEVIKQTHEMKSVEQTPGLSDRLSFLWLALAFGLSLD